eukprot:138592-Rhodomonas_salina.1
MKGCDLRTAWATNLWGSNPAVLYRAVASLIEKGMIKQDQGGRWDRQRKRKAYGGLRTVTGSSVLGHQATAGSTQRSDQLRQPVPQRRDERTDHILFPDKKTKHTPTAARENWALFYFVFALQDLQQDGWSLKSLAEMALHLKISRDAASSLWDLGWQEVMEDSTLPDIKCPYDYMDPFNSMKL